MKIKKEYVILTAVILLLAAYLSMKKSDTTHYTLPNLEKMAPSDIGKIEIRQTGGTIALRKGTDNRWTLLPGNHRADETRVSAIVEKICNLTVTALVSETKNHDRYELGKGKKIGITAWAGGKEVRRFDVGKTMSGSHTFVTLDQSPSVYHAQGDLRSGVAVSLDDLRDRQVLSFDREGITELTVTAGDQTASFTQKKPDSWLKQGETPADGAKISSILATLSSLNCSGYLADEKKQDLKNPEYVITVRGDQAYSLSLYPKNKKEDTTYPAVSSGTRDPFMLPQWTIDDTLKKAKELL